MRGLTIKLLCLSFLLGSDALAQGLQNSDFSFLFGCSLARPVDPSGARLDGVGRWAWQTSYGYQILQRSVGSLWLEVPMTFVFASGSPTPDTHVDNDFFSLTPGLRYQIPLNRRFSIYGAAGGGYGSFRKYQPTASSPLSTASSHYGVFDFGAGLDFRLIRRISLRTEVRDFVSGRGLSGAPGRHHAVWQFGIALHH